jgi:hypothetical protein
MVSPTAPNETEQYQAINLKEQEYNEVINQRKRVRA